MGAGALHAETGVVCGAAGSCEACGAITGPGRSPAAASALRCHVWRFQEGKQDANGQEATPLRPRPVADNPGGTG